MTSIIKVDQIQNTAGGVPTAADLGLNVSGSVLQVKQTVVTNTFSTTVGGGFVEMTDFRTTITPSSTSSKILVKGSLNVGQDYWQVRGKILRDGTAIGLGETAGSRIPVTWNINTYDGGSASAYYWMNRVSFEYLDSPSSTSPLEYSLNIGGYSASYAVYLNRTGYVSDNSTYYGRPISTLTLMEIAG